jgi:subtilase family serine protease
MNRLILCLAAKGTFLLCGVNAVFGQDLKVLHDHVPTAITNIIPKGRLAGTNQLRLAIGLPLHDPAGLDAFLGQVYDPASPLFRQYLTLEELTARFGPTEQDYEAVRVFAQTNGLKISGTHANRLLLDVVGPASTVEKAFHLTLRTYPHPNEARDFYAPDMEPTVDVALPVADVQGLSDYSKPHPRLRTQAVTGVASAMIFAMPMRRASR